MADLQYLAMSFLGGLAIGFGLDFLWSHTAISKYEKHLEALEHYHWGLILLTLVRTSFGSIEISLPFAGIGVTLIITEARQNHPFAFRSTHQIPSTVIGLVLAFLVALAWFT